MKSQKKFGNYIIERTLGTGTTGKVKLGRDSRTEKRVAIKIINKSIFKAHPTLLQKIQREIALMRLIDHPNILGLVEVIESKSRIYIVEQYASKGSLFNVIQTLTVNQAFDYFRQIIYGLDYLHQHGICHRDLKPENLLLDYANQILIADFGFACWMPDNVAHTSCGSPHYAAPEVTHGGQYDGCAADVWSSGVILYAMINGFLPFDDDSIRKTIKRIRKAKYRMPNSIDPVIQDLIKKILTADPSKRITIKQIKQHPAIRIGLPYTYYLPAPFPIPTLTNPIVISSQNDSTLDSLQQIGFVDRSNLLTLLQSDTPNMAKVFYLMLTQPFDLETLPWGKPMMSRSYPNLIFEHPFVFPVDYDSNYTDPFDLSSSQQSSPYNSPLNASVYNMDQSDWVPNPPQIIYEQEQNIRNISLSMPLLMLTLQKFFTEKEYDWFHPNDRTIVTKQISMSLPFYITLLGIYDEKDITKITLCVKMTKGTADDFYMFFEMTRSLLSSYIEIVSDIELNDFNTLGNQPNVEMDVEDYAPDQNCNPI